MAANKKNELILKTYELLKTTSPCDIKIRTIAAQANCTSATIYKHFEDFDQLILFASVKFLENYIIDLHKLINEKTDNLEMLIAMWQMFSKYAFENIEVFDLLFWGKYKQNLATSSLNTIRSFRMNGNIWTACSPRCFLIMKSVNETV